MARKPTINVPAELDRLSKQIGRLSELYENDRETLVVWDGERHLTNDRIDEVDRERKALGTRTDSQVSEIGRRLDGLTDACSSADRQSTRTAEKHDELDTKVDRQIIDLSERSRTTRSQVNSNSGSIAWLKESRFRAFRLMVAVAVVGSIPGIIALVQ